MASNTFIHKHYEKVILAGLLLLCSGLLYLQLSVVQKSQGKKVDDIVNAPEPPADFKPADYSAPEYSKEALFDQEKIQWRKLWEDKNPYTGDKNAENVDMMVPVKMGLCKNNHSNEKMHLIPISCFPPIGSTAQGKCTFEGCGVTLDAPKKDTADIVNQEKEVTDNDVNRNGIPDAWEKEHNIFTEAIGVEGEDAEIADSDGDGFNNKEEYLAKTHPCDPKSHPALVTKLFLDSEKLPENVAFDDFLDQSKCGNIKNMVFEAKLGAKRAKFRYTNANGKFSRLPTSEIDKEILYRSRSSNDKVLPSIGFRLVKLDAEEIEVKDARTGNMKKVKTDYAEIVSVSNPKLRFKCYKNKSIITGHLRVFIVNKLDGKSSGVRIGDKIQLGNDEIGKEEYTVSAIQGTGDSTVLVLQDAKNAEVKITYPVAEDTENVGSAAE